MDGPRIKNGEETGNGNGNENLLIAQLDDGNFNMKCETLGISSIHMYIETVVCVSLSNLVERFSSIFDR